MEERRAPSDGHEAERLRAIGRLREAYAAALLAGEDGGAERTIRDALDAGLTEGVIHDAVITPAMRRVGDLWSSGELTVADEHLATQITLRMVGGCAVILAGTALTLGLLPVRRT